MRAVIFDMDGTLLDSMGAWGGQLERCLKVRGIDPPNDLLDRTKTLGMELATKQLIDDFHLHDTPEGMYREMEADMAQQYATTIQMKPGALEYMQHLHQQGIPMCIATASAHYLVDVVMQRFQLDQYVQFVLTVSDVGVGKTRPDLFLRCAERLNTETKDCIVIEDSLAAIRSAHNAGFQTIGIAEPTAIDELSEIVQLADVFIQDFTELPKN